MVKMGNVEINDLDGVLLTRNGVVVGHIEIEPQDDDIKFCGRGVNHGGRALFDARTHNGFACGEAILLPEAKTFEQFIGAQL